MDDPPGYTILTVALLGYGLIITLGLISILLTAAVLISASEVAFFSLKNSDLDRCRQSTKRNEQLIAELLQKPRLLLATIRIASTLVIIGISVSVILLLVNFDGSRSNLASLAIILGSIGVAITLVLVSEIIPKTYASFNIVAVARYFSRTWKILVMLFKPITAPWLKVSSLMERGFENKGHQDTVEELNQALEMAAVNHGTTDGEKEILRGIVNFGTLTVKQVMRTRSKISAVDITLNFHKLMADVSQSGYSRVPVYRKSLDRIEGILHIKDLLPFMEHDDTFEWQTLLRPGFFVPGAKKLDSLLKDFQEKHVHMAIVVNEYGGTLGLITLEDIIEEIIGEINDEFDEVALNYQKIDDKTFVLEGKTTLHDFCKLLNLDPGIFDAVKRESKTLSGLILELNRELPKTGSQITYEQFTFAIESADRRRIKRVKVSIHDREEI